MSSSSDELGERRRRPRDRKLDRRRLDDRRRSLGARGAGLTREPEARWGGRARRGARQQALCCLAAGRGVPRRRLQSTG